MLATDICAGKLSRVLQGHLRHNKPHAEAGFPPDTVGTMISKRAALGLKGPQGSFCAFLL